jgi:uncharacterized protein YkwD
VSRRFPSIAAVAIVAATSLTALSPAPAAAVDGAAFLDAASQQRVGHGLGPVFGDGRLDRIAVARGKELAADRELGHDMPALIARLQRDGVCFTRVGEIVAFNQAPSGERVARFVAQWMGSTKHRDIMLGSRFTHAGGSWTTGADNRHYGVMIFVALCGHSPAPPPLIGGFRDIGASKFRDDIVWLAERGITRGCAFERFCPDGSVLRDQMATFLRRAESLPTPGKDHFIDDTSNTHEDSINSLADAGLTRGCEPGRYCPSGLVTRAQMASFLVRALELPPAGRDYFGDDEHSTHEDAINRLAAAGITAGCAPNRFCPYGTVTRGQMAAFLHRAFD